MQNKTATTNILAELLENELTQEANEANSRIKFWKLEWD